MGIVSKISALRSLIFVLIGIYIGIGITFYSTDSEETGLRASTYEWGQEPQSEILTQLKESRDEIKRLKSLTQDLDSKYGSSLLQIQKLEESCHEKDENELVIKAAPVVNPVPAMDSAKVNRHPLCQAIMPHPVPTAMDLWNQHILKIFSMSRIPQDVNYDAHDFTAELLQIISPRLPRSAKTVPFDWRPIENALTVAWERYKYLQLPEAERETIPVHERPRPLKVLVMGGSVTVGRNCGAVKKEMNFQWLLPLRECNWSSRLGHFLNNLILGEDEKRVENLVEITKVAMGGTNTATGSVIWQYDLVPEEARNPDIVINSYSTNDMHILTILEAQSSNTTLRDKTFDMIQHYVRQVLGSRNCASGSDELIPPLLLHVDDYLGNEQFKIWDTTELTQGVQVLANYYGFVSVSYADVIREFVYGDTYERWFSAEWWVGGGKTYKRQIHPGMGMHISQIWVTAYNFLHLASSYCSMPTGVIDDLGKNNINKYQAGLWGLPELKMDFKEVKGKPKSRPNGLPPELTKELLLEDITSLWKTQSEEEQLNQPASKCKTGDASSAAMVKCPFSWVSGLSLQQNDVKWVREYFEKQSSTWEGWELSNDEKIGFVPSTKNADDNKARMVLDFAFSQKIQSITIFFMKSYGEQWENSELSIKILLDGQQDQSPLEERNILGTHSKKTSEMYTEEIILTEPVDAGEKFQLEATLVGGKTFKMMGLAVCS